MEMMMRNTGPFWQRSEMYKMLIAFPALVTALLAWSGLSYRIFTPAWLQGSEWPAWLLPAANLIVIIFSAAWVVMRVQSAVTQFEKQLAHLSVLVEKHEKAIAVIKTVCRYRHPNEPGPVEIDSDRAAIG